MFTTQKLMVLGLLVAPFASAHCLISKVTGDAGGNGTGFGVTASGINSLADVTVFKAATGFGATSAVSNTLRRISHGGTYTDPI